MGVDPFGEVAPARAAGAPAAAAGAARDPFDSNQAIPTLMFGRARGRATFACRFPTLALGALERFAGLAYPASGGFSRAPFLPLSWWRGLDALEHALPSVAFRALGFRMLVVIERV